MNKICIIIPTYNHALPLQKNIQEILATNLPLIIVDDGSDCADRDLLQKIFHDYPQINLVKLYPNQGKGPAMIAGFHQAIAAGFTHAIQIDADGQHQISDLKIFEQLIEENPTAVINGCPIYDQSVPKSRLYGRKITNFWVTIETLSRDIKDAMCGFRAYPLNAIEKILQQYHLSKRMGFDIEIIVLLHRHGTKIINQKTRVIYPQSNSSNFRMWRDNLQISLLHAKLFLGLIQKILFKHVQK